MNLEMISYLLKTAKKYKEEKETITELKKVNENLLKIQEQVNYFRRRLDDDQLNQYKSALRTVLRDAPNILDEQRRNRELDGARDIFKKMIQINPEETMQTLKDGNVKSIDNKALICLGFLGNFLYFLQVDEIRAALIQAYDCVSTFPETIFIYDIFDDGLFTKNYITQWRTKFAHQENIGNEIEIAKRDNKINKILNASKKLLIKGPPAALGAALGSLVGAPGTGAGAVWNAIDVKDSFSYKEISELEKELENNQNSMDNLRHEMIAECQGYLDALSQVPRNLFEEKLSII